MALSYTNRKNSILMKQLDNLLCEYEHLKDISGLSKHEKQITKGYVMYNLINKYNLPIKSLYTIVSFIQTKWKNSNLNMSDFIISKIEAEPQNFITQEEVLISFDVVERICKLNSIPITPQCWANNYFLTLRKSFYVSTRILREDAYAYFKDISFYDKVFVRYNSSLTTTKYYLDLEKNLGKDVKNLFHYSNCDDGSNKDDAYINAFIAQYEESNGISFNTLQKRAVINCIQNNAHIICGFPGTGKSTIFDVVKAFFYKERPNYNISCLAPTGLAVKNLVKKCPVKNPEICGTIHRMLYNIYNFMDSDEPINNDEEKYINNELTTNTTLTPMQKIALRRKLKVSKYSKLIPDMIIVDEFSMVDMLLLKPLVEVVKRFGSKLIIMGDENQLPPVGPGSPLYRLTNSKKMENHITYLTDIMRQDNALLVSNIKRIKEKEYLMADEHFDNKTMFMLNYSSFLTSTKEVCYEKLVDFIKSNNLDIAHTQILSPENNKNCGCGVLNTILQKFYNPPSKLNMIPSSFFRIKDLVVRTQNCPVDEKGIFANGDIGFIKDFGCKESKTPTVVIQYDSGDTQELSIPELHEDFALRYCLTIHKSQGGEYDNVVLFMGTPHEMSSWRQQNSNKLLYTAVSRAKKRCFIIAKDNLLNITQTIEEKPPITSFLK